MGSGLSVIDGSVVVGIASGILGLAKFLYDMKKEQKRLIRDVRGADDDDTRDGLAVEQERGFEHISDRLDEIDAKMDREFTEAERERRETREKVDSLGESFDTLTTILSRQSSLEHVDLLDQDYPNGQTADEDG